MHHVGHIQVEGTLSAVLIRADGSTRKCFTDSQQLDTRNLYKKLLQPLGFWRRVWTELKSKRVISAALTFAAFMELVHSGDANTVGLALVTTAGVNYLAADFLSSSSNHISNFNFHDSGTGTTAAAIGDTTLVTQAGPTTRATGTQSNPVAGSYRSVGTISYTSPLAITEWGIFSQAAQGGTLWDRRVFSVINVANGDSIQTTYTCVINAGGS